MATFDLRVVSPGRNITDDAMTIAQEENDGRKIKNPQAYIRIALSTLL